MTNAKEELLSTLTNRNKALTDIKALSISLNSITIKLTEVTLQNLEVLDVDYDSGYGSQELYGIILFSDNTWLERYEYDGSEHWKYKSPPTIEDILT